jgi:hypothetical protein
VVQKKESKGYLGLKGISRLFVPKMEKLNAGLIVTSLVTFIITAAINGLAGSGAGVPDIFYSTVGNISDKYQLYITPAGWFRDCK